MNLTAADLTTLSNDLLRDLGDRLEKLAWQRARLGPNDPRYTTIEAMIDLVEAEEDRRFGPA